MSSSHPPPPSAGLVAGKYEIVRMIGRGGMGSVWEGRHATLGTSVAIKFIEAEYAHSKEARSRFDTEARAAATIQSKHAIQIFDHGVTEEGKPYIVMEFLRGEPLDRRLDRATRISLEETARILQQVSRALTRAHDSGIIHRDLKPENIFLVRQHDDDEEIAKVLDFGIAKMKAPPGQGSATSSTKTGAVLGTPFFMSPEQARGLRIVDHRTDVWSIGVIAFKCVTGVLPFEGESVGDLLVKICVAPIPLPSQVVPGLPGAFDAWFARSLDRDPQNRFSSVQEQAEALAAAAGLGPRRASGPDAFDPTVSAQNAPRVLTPMQSGPGIQSAPGMTPHVANTPYPGYPPAARAPTAPLSSPGMLLGTSAPFTAPMDGVPGVPKSSRLGILFAVGAFALLGLGATAFIVMGGKGHDRERGSKGAAVGALTATLPVASAAPLAPPPLADAGTGAAASTAPGTAGSGATGLAPLTPPATPTPPRPPPATPANPRNPRPPAVPSTKPATPPTQPATPPPQPPRPPPRPAPTIAEPGF